jgi:hypothetical protein
VRRRPTLRVLDILVSNMHVSRNQNENEGKSALAAEVKGARVCAKEHKLVERKHVNRGDPLDPFDLRWVGCLLHPAINTVIVHQQLARRVDHIELFLVVIKRCDWVGRPPKSAPVDNTTSVRVTHTRKAARRKLSALVVLIVVSQARARVNARVYVCVQMRTLTLRWQKQLTRFPNPNSTLQQCGRKTP